MLKPWQAAAEWQRGHDSTHYENLARHFACFALRDDNEAKASMAALMYGDAMVMRRYERAMREAGQPKPQRKHPPQSRANQRGELTARQLEIWLTISDEFQSPTLDFTWLCYAGGNQRFIRPDAKISDKLLQALERHGKIEITGTCPNGTLFRIVTPDQLPPRRTWRYPAVDATW